MCGLVFFSFQRNAQLLVLCLTACKKVSFCWRARTGWRETKACSEIKKPRGICSTDWRCCITLCNVQRGRNLHSKMVIKYIFAKKTGNVSVKKTQSRKNHPPQPKTPPKKQTKKTTSPSGAVFPSGETKRDRSLPALKLHISKAAQCLEAAVSEPQQGTVPWAPVRWGCGTRYQPCTCWDSYGILTKAGQPSSPALSLL